MSMESSVDSGAEAARRAHTVLVEDTDLYANVLEAAGQYDAKVDSAANSSLAAHILNAVTIGVNTFVYQAVGPDDDYVEYEEEIRVLAAALALHDTNKYVYETYGVDTDGNTAEAFDHYFDPPEDGADGDDFGINEFLGGDYREDLHYLVQRTEVGEDSRETRGVSSKFRGLERYCRIGDRVASVALREGIRGAYDALVDHLDEETVNLVSFTEIEQPVLNELLLGASKEVIAGDTGGPPSGVVIGSTPDGIIYLGTGVDRDELRANVSGWIPERISAEFSFDCKLNWNSFDYDILAEVEIPAEKKEEIITNAFRDLLEAGSAGVEPFEYVPEAFDDYFPVLAKAIYVDGQSEFDDSAVQEVYDEIEDEQGVQKVKLHFVAYLLQHREEHAEFLDGLAESVRPELHDDLEPESDAIGEVVDRFFEGQAGQTLGSKGEMCFLCGAETDTKYQKGLSAVYRTQEYSRRVPPHAKYKSICEVCNLEYALLSDICERSDVSTNNNLEVAYFYFDDFVGDVRVRSRRAGNIVQGEGDELDDPEIRTSLVKPQYHIQPVYILDENHRMAVLRQVMAAAQESGMKVVVGRPFTRFDSADTVFTDEEATRPQELLGLDEVERFGPLPDFVEGDRSHSHLRRALQLFSIMSTVGRNAGMNNPYLQLDRDTFHSIADFAVVNHEYATRLEELRSYFETYHEDALMDMKTVAERGVDLFGKQYDSKYKKTKVFREALDAFLSGMNQRMDDEQLVDYVESQVYAAADREDYAGHVTTEQAEAFVEAIRTYLVDNDLYDLKKLSDWENALVNSYYYAYDQTLQD
jgi:CRISPR-associated protein Csc3